MLQEQLTARGINLEIKALANDTVGTMEAAAYKYPETAMGVILGTGTNAAYIEKTKKVRTALARSHSLARTLSLALSRSLANARSLSFSRSLHLPLTCAPLTRASRRVSHQVGKWKGAPCEEMVINTEWGNLDTAGDPPPLLT